MLETQLGLEPCFLIFILLLISRDPIPNEHNLVHPEEKPVNPLALPEPTEWL